MKICQKAIFGDYLIAMKYIYTSYFAAVKKLPDELCPIAICGKSPDWWNGKSTKVLAPKLWFFKEWKKNHDNDFYIKNFNSEVLSKLEPIEVVKMLNKMSDGKTPCMICYEKPLDFCHRHIVAEWLNTNIPEIVTCVEYNEFEYNLNKVQR